MGNTVAPWKADLRAAQRHIVKKGDQAVQIRFLGALRSGHTISWAADKAGASLTTVYRWREQNPAFAASWAEALEAGTDRLEDVAVNRAIKHSDRMLEFLLKGRRPEKYRENRGPITDSRSVTVNVTLEQAEQRLRELGYMPPLLIDPDPG